MTSIDTAPTLPLAKRQRRRTAVTPRAAPMWMTFFLLPLFAGTATAQQRAAANSSIDPIMDSLVARRSVRDVTLSPDGKSVAWVEGVTRKIAKDTPRLAIYVAALGSSAPPQQITAGEGAHAEHGIAWSP